MVTEAKKLAFSLLLCMALLAGLSTPGQAQTATGLFTLADLGKPEIRLVGPYDSTDLTFGLPASWKVGSDVQLTLNITVAFNASDLPTEQFASGGALTVSFNRKTVQTILLDTVETKAYVISIPAAYMVTPRSDGLMELGFDLESGISCFVNQYTSVVIGADSQFSFSYTETLPDTSLINFPRPIYERSIYPDSALVVIPNEPTSAELQSAFSVAAGLGNITGRALELDLLRVSELTAVQKSSSHLILVGKATTMPALSELNLPMPLDDAGRFGLADPESGIVQMVGSPWNRSRVILVVSGNEDAGVVKAAQAVSTGQIVPNTSPNLAIVSEVRPTVPAKPLTSDQTLADMGFGHRRFESRGVNSEVYSFVVPAGSTVSSDAFFELTYGHSALLNYDLSGLIVLLNTQPIGSVRFSEETSGQATNTIRFGMPPSLVLSGRNSLEVRANLEPMDNCANPDLKGLWTVVWPESRLFLPFVPSQIDIMVGMDLGSYPAPMALNTGLTDTAIVFSRTEPGTWRSALQIASFLGDRANISISQLRVFFDDELDAIDLSPYHIIVLGRPSQLSIIERMRDAMPVPFEQNSDIAIDQFSQVTYQYPENLPIGYLELFHSPWNHEKIVITALGNNPTGQQWAAASLVDVTLRSQLGGNFAVINDARIQTVDTRLTVAVINQPVDSNSTAQPEATSFPRFDVLPGVDRPAWILPVLIVAALLSLALIGAVIFLNRRRVR